MSVLGQGEWTGRRVLVLFVAFFAVVFAANAVFIYLATVSWSGLSTDDAYRKGLAYNRTIARAEAQQALGWQAAVSREALASGAQRLTLSLSDRDGRPIDGRSVAATLRRPPPAGDEVAAALEWIGAGRYAAELGLADRGRWDVRIEVARGADAPYLIETQLWPN